MIPEIRGDRVVLRSMDWREFSALAAMWQEPEVAEHIPFAPVSPSQTWVRFNRNNYAWVRHGMGNWAVVDQANRFLGTTGFFRRAGQAADVPPESGWVFCAAAHGQGYGSEAVALGHRWFDAQSFGGRSKCMMGTEHAASIRVAEKTGYQLVSRSEDEWGEVQEMERLRP